VATYRECVIGGICSAPSELLSTCLWTPEPGPNEDMPINCLTWVHANQVATWLGGRLPSEAEWEFAASNRGESVYPWGNQAPTCTLAQGPGCGPSPALPCAHPSGSSSAGVCDLAGNLWEWVQDERHTSYVGAPTDGSAWCDGECPNNTLDPNFATYNLAYTHVLRGGSFKDKLTYLRSSARIYFSATYSNDRIGVRLVRLGW
jgi:formylglycine-generating enzyme required for sulfatase activity